MNETKKKAVIIGAGVGGIATAVFLSQKGFEVEVYEKNANAGGRCGQFIQDGHRFDMGATILLMPSIYRKVFESLGLNMDKEMETTSLEPVYKLFFGDGTEFSFTRDAEKMEVQLENIEPGSFQNYERYIQEGYSFFDISINGLLGKNFYHIFQFINLNSILLLIKLKTWIKHTNYIKRFFKWHLHSRTYMSVRIHTNNLPFSRCFPVPR
jgi:phytoene dehydrogenase-like protein